MYYNCYSRRTKNYEQFWSKALQSNQSKINNYNYEYN